MRKGVKGEEEIREREGEERREREHGRYVRGRE